MVRVSFQIIRDDRPDCMCLYMLAKKMLPAEFTRREVPDSQTECGNLSALLRPVPVERRTRLSSI